MSSLRHEPADPTLTLTTEDVLVRINGDTAIVTGKRVERRRSPDNNQEGVAYARYTRTYVKRAPNAGASENLPQITQNLELGTSLGKLARSKSAFICANLRLKINRHSPIGNAAGLKTQPSRNPQ